MIPEQRYAEYEAIAREVIDELKVSETCKVLAGREPVHTHGWYVHLKVGEDVITVSGNEALPDSGARDAIKSKIANALHNKIGKSSS